ncbi:MAG TPA: DUF1816 domain-containing protein [Oscillatoriaceae cyanobacterium M33_DOE_052]|uniref:DUF1816 domain-containing protein n=1 Tax=Planktothricoides sp. SpSt-374 TaxID=2282167 RepID=A0A7C3ZVZ9_9CYAN|nr:DUF1816 domain-containing protein [Oscillatoriaceae cyanobacterium M33_DOE_052]
MFLAERMKEAFTSYLEKLELAWWVEIFTLHPECTYYFGPFMSAKEAELARDGYIEDLEGEGAQGISVQIKRCQPQELTIDKSSD